MIRILVFIIAAFFITSLAQAAATATPPDLQSLAEQLAPFVKDNPDPTLPPRKHLDEKPKKKIAKPSPVEDAFSQRAAQPLDLFGYNQIGRHLTEAPTTGQVQDDVILGSGDRIMITFRGQRDDSKTYTVTPQGELIINGLDPITVSGMSVGALRTQLEKETARNLLNSTVFISVKSLRQMAITVMGEVKNPGVYTLNPFQTVLDTLAMSKGITKNGSLRRVKLIRNNKAVTLDFYQLLLQGDLGTPLQLRDGDKIMVPVLGETIAVSGDVKRPGIFENADKKQFSFEEILDLSGGVIRPGANQFVKLSLTSWGDEKVTDIYPGDEVTFNDGDMLMVTSGKPMRTNGIQITGHVRQPGFRSLDSAPDLKSLLDNPRVFREGIYPLIAVIERIDTKTLAPILIEFSPAAVLQGKENKALRERDHILFFSTKDIRYALNKSAKQEDWQEQKKIADIASTKNELEKDQNKSEKPHPLLTKQMTDFLSDRAVAVNGAVLKQGLYPVAGKVVLTDLFAVAGGLKPNAEKSSVDILLSNNARNGKRYTVNLKKDKANQILIAAKDKVTVSAEYTTAEIMGVELFGEVKRPGKYDLRKGDTLLDLIDRAGGMTSIAFPEGTVFMRESERLKQEEQFRTAARSIDLAVAGYYLKQGAADNHTQEITNAQKISSELRQVKALGRITIEANPEILRNDPHRAILLQQGDRIYIPRQSPMVTIAGEVLSPLSMQYQPGLYGSDYIALAGGTTKFADRSRQFVVFPDGSASPLTGVKKWFGREGILPGSTIIVPRNPDPLDFLRVTESIGNILSQMAITSITAVQLQRPYY